MGCLKENAWNYWLKEKEIPVAAGKRTRYSNQQLLTLEAEIIRLTTSVHSSNMHKTMTA
jgi:hypothetical protein